MIAKINDFKSTCELQEVKNLCETAISTLSSVIYNNVTPSARFEIERATIENLFEGLEKIEDKLVEKWVANEKRVYSIKNLGVRTAINVLKETEGKFNPTLDQILELFNDKIDDIHEVLLYEEFISALSSGFDWIPGVTTQLDTIAKRVDSYKNDVDITKIIETMKSTRSNYLLPLIEDVVNNYLNNKTEQTKHFLKETLVKFTYDPFIRDLVNLLIVDATSLQLEYANARIDIEKVYSPLMYLGENEVLFNVKGTYYIKKGNNINKIKKDQLGKVDEKFKNLCETINVSNVIFDRKSIKIYVGDNTAIINESSVTVNDKEMSNEDFKKAAEISEWVGNTAFYVLTEILRENFDEIVEVDFVKRVCLKEDENYAADIFRLRDNIFINTYDPEMNKSIFYRNINPIQAEKIIKEHLNFDVSQAFDDILPNKEKILAQIDETKRAYIEYIDGLVNRISEFKHTPFREGINEEVIEVLEEELEEVKTEFKDYSNEVEKYTQVAEGVTVTIDVDGEKYTVPIPEKTSTAKGEDEPETGTEVGAEHIEEPASEITFDDDESELLGDSPSIQDDQIDLGVDNVEAAADDAEAEAEEADEEGDEDEVEDEGGTGGEGEEFVDSEEEDEEETQEEKPKKKKKISKEEPVESLNDELEKSTFVKEGGKKKSKPSTTVKNADAKPKPPKVFLKKNTQKTKKVQESEEVKKNDKPLNERVQIGDTVTFDKEKAYVIGQTNDGDVIIQIQGSTKKVNPGDVVEGEKPEELVKPQYDFDKLTQQNLTTKALFEQYVKCGIYMGRVPVKTSNCFVKYSDWRDTDDEKPISVLIEGNINLLPRKQIHIYEDVNDFANPENYVKGVIIDEATGEALEPVLVNAIDYSDALGDADMVRIIKGVGEGALVSSVSAASVRTLSV